MRIYFNFLLLISVMTLQWACQSSQKTEADKTPEAPSQTIHEAAFLGNTKAIEQHIQAGSDLNVKDQYGSTALTIAALFNKPEVAKLLIDANADIHVTSADGSTPLHTAAFLCRIEIVEALLAKGANKELTNSFGSTPLQSVQAPFESVKPAYDQISRDLGPLGFKLDYDFLEENRQVIAEMLTNQ
ncbi:MAG: ankyrin repeat domain-containing protein [Cytophagales bacterium]|nr:ankyrin repeat domain-containing protein [Cytophagales bacterium]